MANFKKKMASALAVLTLFTYASATCMTASASNILGDVNNDNKIDNSDTLLLENYVRKTGVSINRNNADINGDGDINLADVVALMRAIKAGVSNATQITLIGALKKDKWYSSPNGQYFLVFQGSDGNLVLYRKNSSSSRTPYWSSETNHCSADLCQLQEDGNFVIYDKYKRPVWCTNSYNSPTGLFIDNNGELFIYSFSEARKTWSSKNSHGTKINQQHIHVNGYKVVEGKLYYGCLDCFDKGDYVDFKKYCSENKSLSEEDALKKYLELLGMESDKIDDVVKAYDAVYNLNKSQKAEIKNYWKESKKWMPNDLPDCKGKDFAEKVKICCNVYSVYNLFHDANETVDVSTLNNLIDVLKPFSNGAIYGSLLDGIQNYAQEAIKAGVTKEARDHLLELLYTPEESDPPSDFWANKVTANGLRCQTTYDLKRLYGNKYNRKINVERFMNERFNDDRINDGPKVYEVFKNIKCVQAATGEDFWDLIEQLG
ncbi:lectin [Ruminococcus albus SY3]|uniref:Lectin n=1 Tax=Ruminococcus albus SY3 TaxID=1341156 RepID=A0A011WKT2_RUMAL|nr:dockerin type I domain-containing protein [Ruminococcus albus]EXM37630.1 lectin [Ruminococcus albus SY3]